MFFIFPIRTEKDTKGYPNFTIALIVINLLIWIFTSKTILKENKQLINLHLELSFIESQYMTNQEKFEQLKIQDPLKFHELIIKKNIIPPDSQSYIKWLFLYNKFKKLIMNSFLRKWGFIPAQLNIVKLLISLFLHSSFWHVFFNMLFLWIVGCNMEDDWGWLRFLGLYFLSGITAGLFHAFYAGNMTQPCVGASGAVAGIMGGFMVQHFKTKIRFIYFFLLLFYPLYGTFKIFAGIIIPIWFLNEFINAYSGIQTGTAHWAHIGGFIFGAIAVLLTKYLSGDMGKKTISLYNNSKNLTSANMTSLPVETEYTPAFISQLNQIIRCEPNNYQARIHLARIAYNNGDINYAGLSYNQALENIIEFRDNEILISTYKEIRQLKILKKINSTNLFIIATILEKTKKYSEAIQIYTAYTKWHSQGEKRATSLYRIFLLSKNKTKNIILAKKAFTLLKLKYPEFYRRKSYNSD